AFLQTVLLFLIIRDVLDNLLEPRGLGLLLRHRFLPLGQRPFLHVPPAARDQNAEDETADDQAVVGAARTRARGPACSPSGSPDRPPLPHQIDLNQASPSFRMANPTAMAILGPMSANSSGLNSF